jgi:GNAT superfamily N-acetyltransferase
MWWRLSRAEFEQNRAEGNRRAMKVIVDSGQVPGILAYLRGEPVGWCSVAPRSEFASLNRSPVLKPIDAQPVWSVVCFFVEKRNEGKGIGKALIQGAQRYVASQGGQLLEAYPTVPRRVGLLPPVSSFMGIQKSLASAGFVEVARASRAKSIMRYQVPRSKEQR